MCQGLFSYYWWSCLSVLGSLFRMGGVKLLNGDVVGLFILLECLLIGSLLLIGKLVPQHAGKCDKLLLSHFGVLVFDLLQILLVEPKVAGNGVFGPVRMVLLLFFFLLQLIFLGFALLNGFRLALFLLRLFRLGLFLAFAFFFFLFLLLLLTLRCLGSLLRFFLFLLLILLDVVSGDLVDLLECLEEHLRDLENLSRWGNTG